MKDKFRVNGKLNGRVNGRKIEGNFMSNDIADENREFRSFNFSQKSAKTSPIPHIYILNKQFVQFNHIVTCSDQYQRLIQASIRGFQGVRCRPKGINLPR